MFHKTMSLRPLSHSSHVRLSLPLIHLLRILSVHGILTQIPPYPVSHYYSLRCLVFQAIFSWPPVHPVLLYPPTLHFCRSPQGYTAVEISDIIAMQLCNFFSFKPPRNMSCSSKGRIHPLSPFKTAASIIAGM